MKWTVLRAAVLVACSCSASFAQGLTAAVDAVRTGDFERALSEAQAEPDALSRAQALLYVRHQAGDLEGALRAGREGLRVAPHDPWLRERCAYLALTLRQSASARDHVAALEAALNDAGLAATERERLRPILASHQKELAELEQRTARRGRASTRSRSVAILGGLLLGVALIALARPSRALKTDR